MQSSLRAARGALAITALAAAGCGGNVVVDHASGSGGGGGVGTSSSVQSSSSSSIIAASGSSSSSSTGGGGGLPACETLGYVAVGDSCSPEGTSCQMFVCCDGFVTCSNGVWIAEGPKCDTQCTACGGGLNCTGGAVCVVDAVHDIETFFRCAADPCGPGAAVDCTCADKLCTDVFLMCVGGDQSGLHCTDGTK